MAKLTAWIFGGHDIVERLEKRENYKVATHNAQQVTLNKKAQEKQNG